MRIDLNCDLGESFGNFTIGNDPEVLPLITSANIACGFHAGDPIHMGKTVQLAKQAKTAIGAHPGFPDLLGFGRRPMMISDEELYHDMVYQIGALQAFCHVNGTKLHHVKPHGALYNMVAKDRNLAFAVAKAVKDIDPSLILFGLSNSELIHAGKELNLKTANEVFADRTYQSDGTLTPRTKPNALIDNHEQAVEQVINMVKNKTVKTVEGEQIEITADTVCIHGDGPHALLFVQQLANRLKMENIQILSVGD